jgi:hypothetical protein
VFAGGRFFFGAVVKGFEDFEGIFVVEEVREGQGGTAGGEEWNAAGEAVASEGIFAAGLIKEARGQCLKSDQQRWLLTALQLGPRLLTTLPLGSRCCRGCGC